MTSKGNMNKGSAAAVAVEAAAVVSEMEAAAAAAAKSRDEIIAELKAQLATLQSQEKDEKKKERTEIKEKVNIYGLLKAVSEKAKKPLTQETLQEYGITDTIVKAASERDEKKKITKDAVYPINRLYKCSKSGKVYKIDSVLSQGTGYIGWMTGTDCNGSNSGGRMSSDEIIAYVAKETGITQEQVRFQDWQVRLPNGCTYTQRLHDIDGTPYSGTDAATDKDAGKETDKR